MSDHVISGLIRRRRELTGDMLELLSKVDALAEDVEALDKALRLFAPDIQVQAIPALEVRPKSDWAMRGEVSRIVLSVLREAREPLAARQIAELAHTERGVVGEVTRLQMQRVRKCLVRQRVRGFGGFYCVGKYHDESTTQGGLGRGRK
jgi:hypothetical protein